MGPRRSSGDYRLHQHGVQAHRTQSRPATATDEGGDEGDVVRHRAGYGNDGVWTDGEATGRTGAFHRPRVGDEEVKSEEVKSEEVKSEEVKSESCD